VTLRAVAAAADPQDLEAIPVAADVLADTRLRISWAGYATLDARIAAASAGMLVSARAGGPFAGDVRDALLLNRLPEPHHVLSALNGFTISGEHLPDLTVKRGTDG